MKSMGSVTVSKYKDFYYFYLKFSKYIWLFKVKMITMAGEIKMVTMDSGFITYIAIQ